MRRFSVSAPYDPALDIYNSKEGRKMLAIFQNAPKWKKELWLSKAHTTRKKNSASAVKKADAIRQAREDAERDAAETVILAVSAIQHALMALQDTPAPNNFRKSLSPHAVHNAVYVLRNKCGITFPPDEEFSRPIKLDRVHLSTEQ